MCPETGFALFNYDRVFHRVILFQTGLFENAVQSAGRHINVWIAGHCHGAALCTVFELAVAAFGSCQIPTFVFKHPNEIANFHAQIIGTFSGEWKPNNTKVDRTRFQICIPVLPPNSRHYSRPNSIHWMFSARGRGSLPAPAFCGDWASGISSFITFRSFSNSRGREIA